MSNPTAIGVHIFAGGFTVGIKEHFNVLCHLEDGDYGVETSRANFPDLPHYTDAQEWPVEALADGGVDLIYGNPPCAPFSVNNKSKIPWHEDERLGMIRSQFDLLEAIEPKVWVWESVTGAYGKGRVLVDQLIHEAQMLGYNVSILLFDAQLLGIPQRRRRFFFIAHNVAIPWRKIKIKEAPPIGHWLSLLDDPGKIDNSSIENTWVIEHLDEIEPGEPWRNAFDRLFVHPYIADRYLVDTNSAAYKGAVMRAIKAGKVHGKIYDSEKLKFKLYGRPSWACFRLDPNEVAPTLVGYSWLHPTENRLITEKEMAWINTFPVDYKWKGSTIPSQIARGVLPAVATWLGDLLRQGIEADKPAYPGKTEVKLLNRSTGLELAHWHPQFDLFLENIT